MRADEVLENEVAIDSQGDMWKHVNGSWRYVNGDGGFGWDTYSGLPPEFEPYVTLSPTAARAVTAKMV